MQKTALPYIFLLLLPCLQVLPQEVVTGLIRNIYLQSGNKPDIGTKGHNQADTLNLPFFDDFSKSSVYPDPSKWSDKDVFVNNTYSVKQISAGIATFDALDSNGNLYPDASSFVFEADHLTSLPINLIYQPSDSILLNFFYEAGGVADLPEPKDSLVVHFWAPEEGTWYRIWKAPASITKGFRPVMIRITDSKFLKKGFRFRFTGYASLSSVSTDPSMAGNCDQWNLDYILLDSNRSIADSIPADVAFTLPVRSPLKTFEQMPWKQFRQVFLSEMGPFITVNYRNNDKIVRNVTRSFEIKDIWQNSIVHSFSAGAVNLDPTTSVIYNASLFYTFNSAGTDSALFRIKCVLTTDAFDRKQNDTIIYYQLFGRCFAFDDGSAEAGYGINGLGSRNAMVAYRYKSYIPDTLRAVQICFNDSYQNANRRAFDLMIWDNNQGVPGNVIYSREEMIVQPGEGINGFYTYVLDDPFEISGDFFVGWKQRSETFLNAGFDLNTPHNGRQLYWLNGDWNMSQTSGSVMIRPVFGPRIKPVGIETPSVNVNEIKIWPNPASEYFYIDASGNYDLSGSSVIITDLTGRIVLRSLYGERIETLFIKPGIYFVTLITGKKEVKAGRLIISR